MDGDLDGLGGRGGSSRLQGHPEDVSEREEGQNESRYGGGEAPQVPPRPSEAGRSVNTGPKGVIQDYKEAKQHLEAQRIAKAIQFERKMNALAVGEEKFEIKTVVKMNREENEEDEDSEEMDEEVEEILKEFKIKEIERIQNSIPKFGNLEEIFDKRQFLKAVDEVPKSTYVVIHLYKDTVEACVRLNYSFKALAPQFPHVRFICAESTKILPSYNEHGLPAIVVYKGGDQIHSFVKLSEVLGQKFMDRDVVMFLSKHSVLNLNQDFQIPFPQMEAQRPRTIQITRIGKTRDGLTLGNDSSDDED